MSSKCKVAQGLFKKDPVEAKFDRLTGMKRESCI